MHARPIPVQTKVHFKTLQFLAVCFVAVFSFFTLFKQFLETEMTYSQPIIVRNAFPKIRTYVSRHVKG